MITSIMIVGVGGQGTLLASRVLGALAIGEGFDVKVSEVHGMAQRGGSVVTYVRFGKKVDSPVIEKGGADFILAFEELEALRYLSYLKPGGRLFMNTQRIDPMPVISGRAAYPENIKDKISAGGVLLCAVDALSAAVAAGGEKAVNVVLLGLLSVFTKIPREGWIKALSTTVPERFLELNLRAFAAGEALACD